MIRRCCPCLFGGRAENDEDDGRESAGSVSPISSKPRGRTSLYPRGHSGSIWDVCSVLAPTPTPTTTTLSGGEDKGGLLSQWQGAVAGDRCVRLSPLFSKEVTRVASSRSLLACGSRDCTVKIWSGADPSVRPVMEWTASQQVVTGLALSPVADRVWVGSRDYSVVLWDASRGERIAGSSISRNVVTGLRSLSDGAALQSSEDLALRVWSPSCELEMELKGVMTNFPSSLCASDDSLSFLTGHNGYDGAGTELMVWDRRAGAVRRTLKGHHQSVTGCVFLQDDLIVSCAKDGECKVWTEVDGCISTIQLDGASGNPTAMTRLGNDAVCVATTEGELIVLKRVQGTMMMTEAQLGESQE